jgi:hypothetical protein
VFLQARTRFCGGFGDFWGGRSLTISETYLFLRE